MTAGPGGAPPRAWPADPPGASRLLVHRLGDTGLLVELDTLDDVLALDAAVRAARDRPPWTDVLDVVPAARTLLLTASAGTDLAAIAAAARDLAGTLGEVGGIAAGAGAEEVVELPVRYDGPDLEEVAALVGLDAGGVVAAHTGTDWRVAFGGFAPGFFYLADGDPRLEVPRRAEPRTRVPAGAVGLAGKFSGVYPRSSPGGWQLLGHTDAVLWDTERDPPALLRPGIRVRFVDARAGS